jgi:hypothetical protein
VSSSTPCYLNLREKLKRPFGTHARDSAWYARRLNLFAIQAIQLPTHSAYGPSPHINNADPPSMARHQGRKVSHHAHDFKKDVWPLFSDRVVPTSRHHDTTVCVGHKSARELSSLASFFSHTPLFLLKVCISSKSMTIQVGKLASIPALGGYPDEVSIQKTCTYFPPFFQKVEGTIGGGCVWIA